MLIFADYQLLIGAKWRRLLREIAFGGDPAGLPRRLHQRPAESEVIWRNSTALFNRAIIKCVISLPLLSFLNM